MFVDRRRLLADARRVIGILGAVGDRDPFDERHVLIEQRRVAGRAQVVDTGVGQPQQIVGEMGAHAGTGGCVPPVLHIAFCELALRAHEGLLAQHGGRSPGQRHGVLQLVAARPGGPGKCATGGW